MAVTFPLRLGSRNSPLAMAQAELVRAALLAAHALEPQEVEIVPMTTVGDQVLDRPLADIGGKGLWTKPLDQRLLAGEVDLCVHSLKDVETHRPDAIVIAAMLPRADVRDRLLGAPSIAALPPGARVGTSSPRRRAQLLAARPDLEIVTFRGNVATRLRKLQAGEADATLLAAAGLDRLGQGEVGEAIAIEEMLPACGQGVIAVEVRADDADTLGLVSAIDHLPTAAAARAERRFLATLTADCHSPVGAHARWHDDQLLLEGELLSEDGRERSRGSLLIDDEEAAATLAAHLLAQATPTLRAAFSA